jgi:hypothetical protein
MKRSGFRHNVQMSRQSLLCVWSPPTILCPYCARILQPSVGAPYSGSGGPWPAKELTAYPMDRSLTQPNRGKHLCIHGSFIPSETGRATLWESEGEREREREMLREGHSTRVGGCEKNGRSGFSNLRRMAPSFTIYVFRISLSFFLPRHSTWKMCTHGAPNVCTLRITRRFDWPNSVEGLLDMI